MTENRIGLFKEVVISGSAIDIYERFHQEPDSVFLDSGMSAGGLGRYSFIARDPFLVFSSKGNQVTVKHAAGKDVKENIDPFQELQQLLRQYTTHRLEGLPPFLGGAIGYFGYDLGYIVERLPNHSVDDFDIADCYFGFYDAVIIVDHQENRTYVSSTGFPETDKHKRQQRAKERLNELTSLLALDFIPARIPVLPKEQGDYRSNFSQADYCGIVQQGKDYIAAGDIFQVNLSQRLQGTLYEHPFSLYKRLRMINPAPFASYLHFENVVVASASPERYLLVQGDRVETRPIKGTRPRGKDPDTDQKLRNELWTSEKDRAELVMIIDLERNDLGRVCEYGSVQVPDLIRLEEYATVFHLVSTVTGRLAPDKGIIDLVKASFPGGSITGAPKVRSMEIIDELEFVRRGIYTGSIGYIDFSGDADLNIVIRTFVVKGDQAFFQVGGAIVADSDPQLEYEETLHKARALLRALGHGE
jgi:para-aminobenzoate synthetase component I